MAPKEEITIFQYTCTRCKHVWAARNNARDPRVCAKCKSPYWDKPLRNLSVTSKNTDVCKIHLVSFCPSCLG